MNEANELQIHSRTGQLVSARDEAMRKFQEGMQLIAEASAVCGVSLFSARIMKGNAFGLPDSLTASIELGRQEIDRRTWNILFSETGMDRFWNHMQREAFSQSLRNDPPVASLDVIRSTLRSAMANRRETLAEGLVGLINGVDRSYRSNLQQFAMPKKLVLRGQFPDTDGLRYNGYSPDNLVFLRDFENIACVCCGVTTPGTGHDMTDRLTELRKTDFTGELCDANGWRCRLFANGNVHLLIDSASLMNALNDLISIYFERQLPAGEK